MNILILSQQSNLYSTKRLVEVGQKLKHRVAIYDPLNLLLLLQGRIPSIFNSELARRISRIDVVIARIGPSITDYGLAVVNQFHLMKIPTINPALAIARSRDKFRCLQLLSNHDIDIPRTVMIKHVSQVDEAVKMVGGLPVILKLLRGTQGIGVMLAENRESVLNILWGLKQTVLIQEFIKESKGKDIRAFVIGGRVVAAMRREAMIGEFRSNIHRGGSGKQVDLTREYKNVALKAVKVIGLEVAGVDLLESRKGPKVIEINSSPGFEGLENATDKDIADTIIRYATRRAQKLRKKKC
jgi:ribosomal protein S6--L-glutamate ligase